MKNFLNIIRYEFVTGLWRFFLAIVLAGVLSAKLWINYAQSCNHVLTESNLDSFDGIWYGSLFMLFGLFLSSMFHKNAFGGIRRDVIMLPCDRWPKFWATFIAEVALPTLALFLARYVALLTFDPQLIIDRPLEIIAHDSGWAFPIFVNSLVCIIFPLYWLFCGLFFRVAPFIKALFIAIGIFFVAIIICMFIRSLVDNDVYYVDDNILAGWFIAFISIYTVGMVVAIKRRYERLEM